MKWVPASDRPYIADCVVEKTIPVEQIDALSVELGIVNMAEFDGSPAGTVLASLAIVHHLNDGNAVVGLRLEKYAEPLERTAGALAAVRKFVGGA